MGRSGCRNAAFCLILRLALANKMTKMQGALCAKRTEGPVQKLPEVETMVETILKIDGMMCGMCESHINDVVRKTANIQKVSSSHTRGETVILSEQPLDIEALRKAIAETGYTVKGAQEKPCEKKGFFASLFHKG